MKDMTPLKWFGHIALVGAVIVMCIGGDGWGWLLVML